MVSLVSLKLTKAAFLMIKQEGLCVNSVVVKKHAELLLI